MAGVIYVRPLPQLLELPVTASVPGAGQRRREFVARRLRRKMARSEKTITFCVHKRA